MRQTPRNMTAHDAPRFPEGWKEAVRRKYLKKGSGMDNISDRPITPASLVPCHRQVLASTGLSRLINTGHEGSLRVDINGYFVNCDVEELELRLLASLESMNAYEVFAIPRHTGCTLLIEYSKPSSLDVGHELLVDIQKKAFKLLREQSLQ